MTLTFARPTQIINMIGLRFFHVDQCSLFRYLSRSIILFAGLTATWVARMANGDKMGE